MKMRFAATTNCCAGTWTNEGAACSLPRKCGRSAMAALPPHVLAAGSRLFRGERRLAAPDVCMLSGYGVPVEHAGRTETRLEGRFQSSGASPGGAPLPRCDLGGPGRERRFNFRGGITGRGLGPGIAVDSQVVADFEQLLHIDRVERLPEQSLEALGNVGQVEVDTVALGGDIDAVQIADPLRLDQR